MAAVGPLGLGSGGAGAGAQKESGMEGGERNCLASGRGLGGQLAGTVVPLLSPPLTPPAGTGGHQI